MSTNTKALLWILLYIQPYTMHREYTSEEKRKGVGSESSESDTRSTA